MTRIEAHLRRRALNLCEPVLQHTLAACSGDTSFPLHITPLSFYFASPIQVIASAGWSWCLGSAALGSVYKAASLLNSSQGNPLQRPGPLSWRPRGQDSSRCFRMSEEVEVLSGNTLSEDVEKVVEKISNTTVEFRVPRVNCPEHIILVVDVCHEVGNTPYRLADGSKFSALYMVKRALTLFLQNKHAIDARHKFALVLLHNIPVWISDFTSDPQKIISDLELAEERPATTHCDLSLVFELIAHQISLPKCSNPSVVPPPYMYRTILIYGRSHCLPQFLHGKELFSHLIQSPHFVLDVLYTHESPSDNNKCEGIFDLLCGLDEGGWSYVLEVSAMLQSFTTILAHSWRIPFSVPYRRISVTHWFQRINT